MVVMVVMMARLSHVSEKKNGITWKIFSNVAQETRGTNMADKVSPNLATTNIGNGYA